MQHIIRSRLNFHGFVKIRNRRFQITSFRICIRFAIVYWNISYISYSIASFVCFNLFTCNSFVSNIPRKSRRKIQAQSAVLRRHESQDEELSDDEAYSGVIHMDIEQDDDADRTKSMKFKNKFDVLTIGDMFELCKRKCGLRKVSVLLYMTLRHLGHTWRDIDIFLSQIGSNSCRVLDK